QPVSRRCVSISTRCVKSNAPAAWNEPGHVTEIRYRLNLVYQLDRQQCPTPAIDRRPELPREPGSPSGGTWESPTPGHPTRARNAVGDAARPVPASVSKPTVLEGRRRPQPAEPTLRPPAVPYSRQAA